MHCSSDEAPGAERYVPAGHAVGAAAPSPHQLPGGQASQLVWLLAPWYEPFAHTVQLLCPADGDTLPGGQARGSAERLRQ